MTIPRSVTFVRLTLTAALGAVNGGRHEGNGGFGAWVAGGQPFQGEAIRAAGPRRAGAASANGTAAAARVASKR